ncbi:MAG: ATP-binding protein [Methanosarcina sp.]
MRNIINYDSKLFLETPESSQLSALYNNDEELIELLLNYFKQGIDQGEYCLLITPNNIQVEEVKNQLKQAEIDVEHYLDSSQLEIASPELISKDPELFELRVKEFVEERCKKTISGKFSGFRTNFNFKDLQMPLDIYLEILRKFKEKNFFEEKKNFRLLCTLPLKELSGSQLLELIEEGFYIKRKGKWEYFRNLETQQELENTLLKAKKDAEATNRAKNGFIMNMSHELRTPLNSVIGFSDLLLEGAFGPLNTRQSKYVNNILISGKNLLEIINNLLDISRLESGERSLNYEEIDIASLIGEVRMNLLSPASNKKITMELRIDPGIENIRADRLKLRQIVYNLISNAIKFTAEKGKIIISAYEKEGTLEIKVSDNGIGLSKENYEKIFMPFTQADSSAARGYGGAGLGLYIVKNFTDLHKGKIWIDSEIGKGSTFTVALPIK